MSFPRNHDVQPETPNSESPNGTSAELAKQERQTPSSDVPPTWGRRPKITPIAVFLGLVSSIGGFMFGYVSGQISGFFSMTDFARRFGQMDPDGQYVFSAARQGAIVGLLPVGCLIGALISGSLGDVLGRRLAISLFALWACVGNIIEISSQTAWAQFAVGRLVTGCSIGALSVLVPMYQSESSPAVIRGLVVSMYQLFVTLGIWTSYMVDWGTVGRTSSASWRIPNGLGFLWSLILGIGILALPESPRHAYRRGRKDEARCTLARLAGVEPRHPSVDDEVAQIRAKLEEDCSAGKAHWFEIFTGPRMLYRTLLGIVLQSGQQLTGANFFFYYGTTVFKSTGLSNSYVTQIILGTVNVAATFIALYIVRRVSRRKALIVGAASMAVCFFIYAFVGQYALDSSNPMNTPQAGTVLVVFSCLAIAAFAITWGPLVWAVVAELYPSRYRAPCMSLATAANWFWNFMISFFTRFITDSIHYFYGLVFGGCCVALVFIVYFFVIETKDRTLEEIDTMYVSHVRPSKSKEWHGGILRSGPGNESAQEDRHVEA
ncbi:general substrate transporter [Durotheca rogersii]|uniref:general substrate transporter n=1 Tax=Durotheca rogersii TaxID=419775 RepID=UPI00221F8A5A|nr:general substrate transporter [Durotheca rogersii]KAI5862230.1 general substrate transporter [Durotheca rogersii]